MSEGAPAGQVAGSGGFEWLMAGRVSRDERARGVDRGEARSEGTETGRAGM